MKNYQFFKVYDEHQLEYIFVAKGDSDENLSGRERWPLSSCRAC